MQRLGRLASLHRCSRPIRSLLPLPQSHPRALMATATRSLRSATAAASSPASTASAMLGASGATAAAAAPRLRGRPRKVAKVEAAFPAAAPSTAPAAAPAPAAASAADGANPVPASSSTPASANPPAAAAASPFQHHPSAQGVALLQRMRQCLVATADPSRAAGMQRYMKSEMPFHGCYRAASLAAYEEAMGDARFSSSAEWSDAVATIWAGATHREERGGAVWLLRKPPTRSFGTEIGTALPLLRHLVVQGAWWDYVDEICTYPLGDLLRANPAVMVPELERWAAGDVLWLRRAAILAQLSFKPPALDTDLLFRLIRPAMADQTFWLRKAIGWGLRQAARTHPAEVLRFVRDNYNSLSTLSRREALKHLGGDKGLDKITAAVAAVPDTAQASAAGPARTTKGRKRKVVDATAAAAAAE